MIPLPFAKLGAKEMAAASEEFLRQMATRRSVRDFSPDPVPFEIVENAIRCAAMAPSGANQQPWRFVVVSDASVKREIRLAAEAEERDNYETRFPQEWLDALAPLGTDANKPFLETAPYLIVVFAIDYGIDGDRKVKHYYVRESVGIATGFLIAALHLAGLATLTHTPSPMGFLGKLLRRPANERAFVLLPVGYPADGAMVPDIRRKALDEVIVRK